MKQDNKFTIVALTSKELQFGVTKKYSNGIFFGLKDTIKGISVTSNKIPYYLTRKLVSC